MSADTPTGVLREEHELILQVIDLLDGLLSRGAAGEAYDWAGIEQCAVFFKLFADQCHHGKEEDLLFPVLEARGIPREGGPIGVMLHEHEQGRVLVRQMMEHLEQARGGDTAAGTTVIQASQAFIELLRNHIAKENNILFMMADRVVDTTACQKLCGDYAHVCARKFDGQSKAQLQQLAADLKSKLGTPD